MDLLAPRDKALLDEKREELRIQISGNNWFLTSRSKAERLFEGSPFYATHALPDRHLTRPGSNCFPIFTIGPQQTKHNSGSTRDLFSANIRKIRANLSQAARSYLQKLGIADPDNNLRQRDLCWMHTLAIGHSQTYLKENEDGLKQGWPRVPLPSTHEALEASAALGRQIAALLDPETPISGVTTGGIRLELKEIGALKGKDLQINAGWGIAGKGGIVMPGKGRITSREVQEIADFAQAVSNGTPSHSVLDIWLNDTTCWRNVPESVWAYTLGGYQVLKKWLSYRETSLLGRALTSDEALEFTHIARRIAALRLLKPQLDQNYARIKSETTKLPDRS